MPTVSIVVPNYNHASFLDKRLDTILQQTFTDFELIFLDDASTDESRAVFQKYANHPKIRSKFYPSNSGSPFIQWNRGISMAQGEYIWIAESDDYSAPQFLEVMLGVLKEHPGAALAYCESQIVQENGELRPFVNYYNRLSKPERWSDNYCNDGADELARFLVMQNTIPNASAVLFRRNSQGEVPTAPEHMRLAGDWMFWSRLAARGDVCYVASPLNYFRFMHQGSQRSRTAPKALEVLEGLEVFEFITGQVRLTPNTRSEVLNQQIWVWANMTMEYHLEPGVGKKIRHQLLRLHPQIGRASFLYISLPFAYYYLDALLKRVRLTSYPYHKMRKVVGWLIGRFK